MDLFKILLSLRRAISNSSVSPKNRFSKFDLPHILLPANNRLPPSFFLSSLLLWESPRVRQKYRRRLSIAQSRKLVFCRFFAHRFWRGFLFVGRSKKQATGSCWPPGVAVSFQLRRWGWGQPHRRHRRRCPLFIIIIFCQRNHPKSSWRLHLPHFWCKQNRQNYDCNRKQIEGRGSDRWFSIRFNFVIPVCLQSSLNFKFLFLIMNFDQSFFFDSLNNGLIFFFCNLFFVKVANFFRSFFAFYLCGKHDHSLPRSSVIRLFVECKSMTQIFSC